MNFSKNLYQVNRKAVMELTDILALIIAMQAGFSFMARVMKYLTERCNWMNYSKEESTNLINDVSESNVNEIKEDENDDNHIELSSNIRSSHMNSNL